MPIVITPAGGHPGRAEKSAPLRGFGRSARPCNINILSFSNFFQKMGATISDTDSVHLNAQILAPLTNGRGKTQSFVKGEETVVLADVEEPDARASVEPSMCVVHARERVHEISLLPEVHRVRVI